MPFDAQINFRATSGFVTDGAGQTYCDIADNYPTTRGGWTFGLSAGNFEARDRDSGTDPRLAGIVFTTDTSATFYIDLPGSGNYDIHLAIGDASFSQPAFTVVVKDGSTTLTTISNSTSAGGHFVDATNVERSNWLASEVAYTGTFATTQLVLVLGNGARIAHLRVVESAGGGSAVGADAMHYYRQHVGGML